MNCQRTSKRRCSKAVDHQRVRPKMQLLALQIPGWNPVTIVKGGPAANALCRGLDSEWGKKLVGKTLIRNIAQSIYSNRKQLEKGVRQVTQDFNNQLCALSVPTLPILSCPAGLSQRLHAF